MKLLRRAAALIGHEAIEGEFDRLKVLEDAEFESARSRHLARRPLPARTDNAGVTFVLVLFGALLSLFEGLIKGDGALVAASVFGLIVALVLFAYVSHAARYWREHRAIIFEEARRYGRATFG